jgi:hypothetical protein
MTSFEDRPGAVPPVVKFQETDLAIRKEVCFKNHQLCDDCPHRHCELNKDHEAWKKEEVTEPHE